MKEGQGREGEGEWHRCQGPHCGNLTGHFKDISLCPKNNHRRVQVSNDRVRFAFYKQPLYTKLNVKNQWWEAKVEDAVAKSDAISLIHEIGDHSLDVHSGDWK